MAHNIMEYDRPMFAEVGAWHPLGIIVKAATTLDEALELARLNWLVLQDKLICKRNNKICEDSVQNYRSDNDLPLGTVGVGYSPLQNRQLAELGQDVVTEMGGKDACVETAGSVLNGRKIWFCIRTESFEASKGDCLQTYLMLANAHDRSMAASFFFTSVRVVCDNTFKMALSSAENIIRFRHEGDIEKKLKAVREALAERAKVQKEYQDSVAALSKRTMTADEVKEWIAQALTITEGDLVSSDDASTDKRKATKRESQVEAFKEVWKNIMTEKQILGVHQSAWLVHNGHTKWLQSQRPVRSKDKSPEVIAQKRMTTDLFGPIQEAKQKSWQMAMALVS